MTNPRLGAAAVVGAILASLSTSAAAVTFSAFVQQGDLASALSNNQTIGFAYAGNKFVGSVYLGTNNNQLYQTDLNGGNVAKFGVPLPISPTNAGEIYVSSSLGLGGFGLRDVFAGEQGSPATVGTVYRFNNDGSGQAMFVTGLIGGVRGIGFDPYGLYGNDMIVTTFAGRVYRVNSAGVATLLASTGEDTEGLSFAPQAFGPLPKGTLVVASEGSGLLRAISPAGVITPIATVPSAEMVSFVPLNLGASGDPLEGFYAANFPFNVVKAPAGDFTPFIGDIVVTGEITHQLTDVRWNGSAFVTSLIGPFPNQPEDGIFVTVDILNPCGPNTECRVPVPTTPALLAAALAALAFARRRKLG